MKRFGMVLSCAAFTVVALAACGSVSGVDDLFSSGGGTTGTATTTAGGGASATTSGSTTASTGGASTSSSSTSGSTTGSTSSSTSGSTTASSSSSTSSTSSGGTVAQVYCNNQPCNPGEICCFNPTGPGDHCSQAGQCNSGWVSISCNGPEDCPGGSCCATVNLNMQSPYKNIACQPSCDPDQLVMCSQAAPNVCPSGTTCNQSSVLGAGYDVCYGG